ncbi:Integral membrane protein pth11 [Madurella fahalii]|uniref:Integral membrane protein pth11 n=1 Tax=Madurella fahalii TaxID=1157608 RepID=A0ABQ0GNB1_9PEZI
MAMGGDGPWAVAVMWIVTILTFIFVLLRVYTRALVVQNYGIDDHVYNFAFVLLLCYTIFTTISAHYGFGQNMADIPILDDLIDAILFEAIGQTFAVVGMAVAKWSLGLFLLRLVTQGWHKVAIWIMMCSLMGASISVCFVFWLQCTPPAYLWDRRIPGGYCHIDTTPVSLTLCILCVLADFFFALFPWLFLWNLQMNQREKIVIAASMSLGLIAGACGIKRTVEVPNLISQNYLKDTVGLIVWSAAEIAVTMICIGIPVCRPLYKRFLDKISTNGTGSGGYKKHSVGGGRSGRSGGGPRYGLRTFGGSTMPGASTWEPEGETVRDRDGDDAGSDRTGSSGDEAKGGGKGGQANKGMKLGITPFTETTAVAGGDVCAPDNGSQEEILGGEFKQGHARRRSDIETGKGHGPVKPSIQVTEEWRVDRS